jgi:WD40 repeat protein
LNIFKVDCEKIELIQKIQITDVADIDISKDGNYIVVITSNGMITIYKATPPPPPESATPPPPPESATQSASITTPPLPPALTPITTSPPQFVLYKTTQVSPMDREIFECIKFNYDISLENIAFAIGSNKGRLLIYYLSDLNKSQHSFIFEDSSTGLKNSIFSLSWSPSNNEIVVGTSKNANIYFLESETAIELVGSNKQQYCNSVDWSVDGNRIVAGFNSANIKIWDVTALDNRFQKEPITLSKRDSPIGYLKFIPIMTNPILISAETEKNVTLWQSDENKKLRPAGFWGILGERCRTDEGGEDFLETRRRNGNFIEGLDGGKGKFKLIRKLKSRKPNKKIVSKKTKKPKTSSKLRNTRKHLNIRR